MMSTWSNNQDLFLTLLRNPATTTSKAIKDDTQTSFKMTSFFKFQTSEGDGLCSLFFVFILDLSITFFGENSVKGSTGTRTAKSLNNEDERRRTRMTEVMNMDNESQVQR
jgi:hypothetical protein